MGRKLTVDLPTVETGTPLADRLKQCATGDEPLPFALALLSPLPSLEPLCQAKGYYLTDFLAASVHY